VLFDAYRREAEAFVSEIGLEHYLHFAGLKPNLELEPVYEAHSVLFTPEAVDGLRAAANPTLLEFCVEGLAGRATTVEAAALADREAALELHVDGRSVPLRRAPIEQAVEPDPERREELERARLELTEEELNPLHRSAVERVHELAQELGWSSMTEMCSDISGIDLRELAGRAEHFLAATDDEYERVVKPLVVEEVGADRFRRSDLPAFFRAPSLDEHFPEGPLVDTLSATLSDLGVDAWQRVTLDAESRPTKSPRAFCAAVRVPEEVYLVISPHGGRDDYETILHEAGHSQHYAHVGEELTFEERHLGDNSVTEAYAFLMQRLAAEPGWLARHLGVEDPGPIVDHSRAAKLLLLRRYSAKLAYEVDLHDAPADWSALRGEYARRLSDAMHVDWPEATWLSDVDPFFYAARYLRAWALEAELAAELSTALGPDWFSDPEAGTRLLELWRKGQPRTAADLLGREPDFTALTNEVVSSG
jgi:hypothetical protein